MMPRYARPRDQAQPRIAQIIRIDAGQTLLDFLIEPYLNQRKIPTYLRHFIDPLCGSLHAFVLDQPAYQFRTRVFFLRAGLNGPRQQHP